MELYVSLFFNFVLIAFITYLVVRFRYLLKGYYDVNQELLALVERYEEEFGGVAVEGETSKIEIPIQ